MGESEDFKVYWITTHTLTSLNNYFPMILKAKWGQYIKLVT